MSLPVAAPWFTVDEIEEGIFRITEPHCHRLVRANCFLITGGHTDVLVDSCLGVAALRPLVQSLSDRPLILFTTHTHADHVGGHPEFADATIVVHPTEADDLRRPGIKGLRFPPRSKEQIEALRRGGIELTEFMTDAVPYAGYDVDRYGRAGVEPTRLVVEGCAREFTRANLRELTVHHRDHDHNNNPPDGSNWELLCLYCHDNEHQRQLEAAGDSGNAQPNGSVATHSPFANLKALLDSKKGT